MSDNATKHDDRDPVDAIVLLPCPFCDGSAELVSSKAENPIVDRDDTVWRAYCKGCDSAGSSMMDRSEAARKWNARNHYDVHMKRLQLLCSNFQMNSPRMDGSHTWRFRSGWPINHMKGHSLENAIDNAIAEVEREASQ